MTKTEEEQKGSDGSASTETMEREHYSRTNVQVPPQKNRRTV